MSKLIDNIIDDEVPRSIKSEEGTGTPNLGCRETRERRRDIWENDR